MTQSEPVFACGFCKAKLTTETRLINHVCEQKRRWLHREDKAEKLAFVIYHHFYVRTMTRRKTPTFESFAHSKLYLAFVRFARHVIYLEAVHPLGFVDFLLRIESPIDHWTNPEIYARYIRELNKNETPLEAIERNFMLMEQWAISANEDWCDFFRLIAPPLATLWIISGRISPWLLFTASSAPELLKRLNPEQIGMVDKAVDTEFWQAKMALHQENLGTIRAMLIEKRI